MCGIVGAVLNIEENDIPIVDEILADLWYSSHERGRDGRGYIINSKDGSRLSFDVSLADPDGIIDPPSAVSGQSTLIGNLRAEPTTEFIFNKEIHDQQPYMLDDWAIVHNGTIANDKQLRTNIHKSEIDSAAIIETLHRNGNDYEAFKKTITELKGSFAILATNRNNLNEIYAACNYKPIWYAVSEYGTFFASSRNYFAECLVPQMLTPYSVATFGPNGLIKAEALPSVKSGPRRALVVCSGGLDSVVAATITTMTMETELIHFKYGCRAEGREIQAIKDVAKFLKIKYTIFNLPVYNESDSPLLSKNSNIVGGEIGAEFAHEWVPARNLLLLSVATAYAEANGFTDIVLGNNLEEAGAYPDNEPEFIERFNDLLPFAVADGKKIQVSMPVGNLMKREIVAMGNDIKAPMHLTWSCYRNGEKHCGRCGPCYMRRKAFEMNDLPEVIEYLT